LNEDEGIESLRDSLLSYLTSQERSRKRETIKILVRESTKFQECFSVKKDALLFCDTPQFQLLLHSSPKFHSYLNDKYVPLYEIIEEIVENCDAVIRNRVYSEGILAILQELGWH
jgi:hypothetical protein